MLTAPGKTGSAAAFACISSKIIKGLFPRSGPRVGSGTDTKARGFYVVALLVAGMGCEGQRDTRGASDDAQVVARVGDKTITAEHLRRFGDGLPEGLQSSTAGLDKARDHLQTLVDMELMLMEADEERIAASSAFLEKLNRAKRIKLVSVFQKREIRVDVQEAELREYIENEGLSRALRLADIMVDSEEKAAAAFGEIRAGKSFADVARKWSINRDTADRGGMMDRYLIRQQMVPALRDRVFSLAPGEVSEPIRIDDRYSLVTIVADTTVDLVPELLMQIRQDLAKRKFGMERASLVEELKTRYRLEADRKGLGLFVEKLRDGAAFSGADERGIVLYRYDTGEITAGELVDIARDRRGNVLAAMADVERVISFAEENLIPGTMILEAAVRAGMEMEPDIAAWLKDRRRQLLISELRNQALEGRIEPSSEELREFYDAHPEKYMHPEQLQIQEILVESEPEARRLAEKARLGALLGDLARAHSIRPTDMRDEEGKFHFHQYESAQFGGLVEAAFEADVGAIVGPVKLQDGYSVFKVLARNRPPETFEEAEWRVGKHVKRRKAKRAFNEFLEELRAKYASQVSIHEDNLKAHFGSE